MAYTTFLLDLDHLSECASLGIVTNGLGKRDRFDQPRNS
jgi:hypothetical protein